MNTKKVQINCLLCEYDSALFHKAMIIAFPYPALLSLRDDKRRFIRFAFVTFCRAIIEQNLELAAPLAAELRKETAAELRARCAGEIPKCGIKTTFPHSNLWN